MLRWSRTAPSGRGGPSLRLISARSSNLPASKPSRRSCRASIKSLAALWSSTPAQPATRGRVEARSRFRGRPVQGQCGQRGRALEGLTVARSRARFGLTATSGEQRGGLGPTVPRPARRPRGKETSGQGHNAGCDHAGAVRSTCEEAPNETQSTRRTHRCSQADRYLTPSRAQSNRSRPVGRQFDQV